MCSVSKSARKNSVLIWQGCTMKAPKVAKTFDRYSGHLGPSGPKCRKEKVQTESKKSQNS